MKLTNKSYPIARAVRTALLVGITASMLTLPSVYAAEAEDEESQVEEVTTEEVADETNKLVITGSRLQRETYTSLSPLQVITAEASREVGLIDASDILQGAQAASGTQIDLTFSGFVLDNGPGASTLSLRGLGSNRTLTLLNGRRLAPSGVEGAPAVADINLIPGGLVRQYDLLLDGASSIYGSDAVAGVANIILRQDFDGFEADLYTTVPEQGGGVSNTFNLTWGKNYDRGFVGIGVEYQETKNTTVGDRKYLGECDRNMEVDRDGNITNVDVYYPSLGHKIDGRGCKVSQSLRRYMTIPSALGGSFFYTPGFTNGGIPNFSDWSQFGAGIDSDADGINDVSFTDYTVNGTPLSQDSDLYPENDRLSVLTYGEYTFEGDANLTPFFEASFNKRNFFANYGTPQFFPTVPANNPYNPCNPNGIDGVDCGLAYDDLVNNPGLYNPVFDIFGCYIYSGGSCDQTIGAVGAVSARPVIGVQGDRSTVRTEMEQTRIVAGLKGDLPFMNFGDVSDWAFETYVSYTKSKGTSSREGIRQDRLDQALDVVETAVGSGEYVCTDTSNGCVPVNLFAPSLWASAAGDFATTAERNFLFDSRDFETTYEQSIVSGFAGGSVFELPAGSVTAGFGFELREDEINSIPDDIARDGLFFGFFSDGGAVGSKTTKEYFAEVEIPVLANMTMAKELTLNLSARNTKDEFYGDNTTYSYKIGYRPIDSLLLRATKGTSYRAPNVRENFLRAQSGFNSITDPCVIPDEAWDLINDVYQPENDRREAHVLANCAANGIDPLSFRNNGTQTYSVEIATGGILGLNEETSDSLTYGFSWAQPFTNAFDLTFGATYYEIEINNTIVEPSRTFIIGDCYGNVNLNSTFCSRITRGADGTVDLLDSSFINRDNQTARGIDVNINFAIDAPILGNPIHWTADLVATHTKEASTLFTDIADDGTFFQNYNDSAGDFGYADWTAQLQLAATLGKYRLTWSTRYIGSVAQDPAGVDVWADYQVSDTCYNECRDIGYAGTYMNHAVSLFYYGDTWTIGAGARNVFDKSPPLVDGSEVTAINNAPLGAGYDLQGRTFFVNVKTRF